MPAASDQSSSRFLNRMSLFIARFCISAWIGAATLFVIVGVTEVTRGGFDSATKDMLVAIRFPAFYSCGAILVAIGWLGTFLAGKSNIFPAARRVGCLILLALVLLVMATDYIWIYRPLVQMVTPAGGPKPVTFATYHEASKWINLAGLAMNIFAMGLLNWPVRNGFIDEPKDVHP